MNAILAERDFSHRDEGQKVRRETREWAIGYGK